MNCTSFPNNNTNKHVSGGPAVSRGNVQRVPVGGGVAGHSELRVHAGTRRVQLPNPQVGQRTREAAEVRRRRRRFYCRFVLQKNISQHIFIVLISDKTNYSNNSLTIS